VRRGLSRSLPARLLAMSFIVLILLGNCWFVVTMIGQPVPAWLSQMSRLAIYGALVGGSWLAVLALRAWLRPEAH